MALKETVKQWFKTGLKPTESQFYQFFDSIWWKEEKIPANKIENLQEILDDKADFDWVQNSLVQAKDRASHTGTQLSSTISNFNESVNALLAVFKAENYLDATSSIQGQINAINNLLSSDDVNLDQLQEIVDYIKSIQANIDTLLVNDLVTGGTLKALTAEMGKMINNRLLDLEARPIPEGFYVTTLIASSKLLYFSDQFREVDLQSVLPTTTIVNTNEIVRNGNDLFIVGNYSPDGSLTTFIMRLVNCRLRDNILVWEKSNAIELSGQIHGLICHNGFLYAATITTVTKITKINPYDFTDVRTLTMPATAEFDGLTTDIVGYKDKLYILVATAYYQPSKFIEISDDLTRYRQVFSQTSSTSYRTAPGIPFLIYNDELYIPFFQNATNISVRVYDLQGNIKRERTGITINTIVGGGSFAVPHWIGIFNNKLLITTIYGKSLVRLDCQTLATEESVALATSVTDDNTVSADGYVFLNGEKSSFDTAAPVQLLKVKYNNFTDKTILLADSAFNNGNGSYGSINNNIDKSGLNLNAKKNNYLTKTADYTIVLNDFPNNNCLLIFADATTAAFTITLPTALSSNGYEVTVIKTDASANSVTVKGNGSQLINASNTQVLAAQYDKINVKSNGVQNFII
ncbi:hypothetical protein CFS9_13040 [Flavobacterium sp. CFS9]|uniref:Uncharacterized protein n=1 Tax=Flavobacterium sp. CFS9 TaxID=3143118 RepID=A0AAT9GZL8_9FLAO